MRVLPSSPRPARASRAAWLALTSGAVLLSACRDLVRRTPEAESITLSPSTFDVPVNGSVLVTGTAFDRNNNTISGRTIRFSSENPSVATVTADGRVIGITPGQAIIVGTLDDARGQAVATVIPEVPASVQVVPSTVTLRRTNVRQFTATPRNATGAPITGQTVTWQSSNSAVAAVSPTGEVTALTPGVATITATAASVSGTAAVTVTEIPIGSISLAPQARSLQVNESFIPTVTLRDTASNVLPSLGRPLTWSSSNEIAATVSATGVVTGRRAGTARITAASPENPAISGTSDVTVSEREVTTVVIAPRTGSLRLGVPRNLTVTLLDAENLPVTGRVPTWVSLAPTVATVTATGIVTGNTLGTARIVARIDNAADTVQFTVTRIPVTSVTISPTQASVLQGGTTTLVATVRDSAGTEVTDRPVSWSSGNPVVASVINGVVTGVSTGTASISATAEDRTGTAAVTVLQIPVDSIRLVNAADTLVTVSDTLPNQVRQVQLELLDVNGLTLSNRDVLITRSNPNAAEVTWSPTTRILTVRGLTLGSALISLRALGSNGLPEGRTTTLRVCVSRSACPSP
jgi:uncharacterized protein YjdB